MKQKTWQTVAVMLLPAFFVISCANDDNANGGGSGQQEGVEIDTVAVLCNSAEKSIYDNVLKLFNKNALEAAQGDTAKIQLTLKFVDVEAIGSYTTGVRPVLRSANIGAVIATDDYKDNKEIVGVYQKLAKNDKDTHPLFFPLPEASFIQHKLSGTNYAWFLSCNNMKEADTQIQYVKKQGKHNVIMLATNDSLGIEAANNVKLMAQSNGINYIDGVTVSHDASSNDVANALGNAVTKAGDKAADCFLVVASSNIQHYNYISKSTSFSNVLFSHNACSPLLNSSYTNAVGTTMAVDEKSGFAQAYKTAYGSTPCYGEAQLYDALMLSYLSIYAKKLKINQNDAIRKLLSEDAYTSWQADGIKQARKYLASNAVSRSSGATGSLTIDSDYKNIIKSSYCIWTAKGGQLTLDLSYGDGSSTIDESNDGEDWALVVCGSYAWEDYRHMADALNVTHMLLDMGYKRDHIVTVIEPDSILNYKYATIKNPFPGEIRVMPNGNNLYASSLIDYHAYSFNPDSIPNILTGNTTKPHLSPGPKDNVLIFWSGHGDKGDGLKWMGKRNIKPAAVNNYIAKLKEKGVNRVMMAIEACYSGQFAKSIKQNDVFVITASNENEMSKVYEESKCSSGGNDFYMQDAFAHHFVEYVKAHPKATLRDMYFGIYMNVYESYVTISDMSYYGTLATRSISDFIPKK